MNLKEKTEIEFLKHLKKFILSSGIDNEFISLWFHGIIWKLERAEGSKESYKEIFLNLERNGYIAIKNIRPYGNTITVVCFTMKGLDYLNSRSETL